MYYTIASYMKRRTARRLLQKERAKSLNILIRSLPTPERHLYCSEIAKQARRARNYRKTLVICIRGHCACADVDDTIQTRLLTLVHAIREKDAKRILINNYMYMDVAFLNNIAIDIVGGGRPPHTPPQPHFFLHHQLVYRDAQ